jgi:hypothetical protein
LIAKLFKTENAINELNPDISVKKNLFFFSLFFLKKEVMYACLHGRDKLLGSPKFNNPEKRKERSIRSIKLR